MSGYEIPLEIQFLAEGQAETEADCCEATWRSWYCTRLIGHDGKHEASWGNGMPVAAAWDDAAEVTA